MDYGDEEEFPEAVGNADLGSWLICYSNGSLKFKTESHGCYFEASHSG
jgi:hypothetical protein